MHHRDLAALQDANQRGREMPRWSAASSFLRTWATLARTVTPDDPEADPQRRFDALVSGLGLEDVRGLAQVMPIRRERLTRPELRRPPLRDRRVFRVRVALDDSDPVIWRRLELRSDLPLNVVHQAIQSAFGWWDYHLHRFAIGGGPWDQHSQVFACKEDIDEADDEDEAILDSLVRFDETLREAGDVLHYAYDYGDSWELTIRLEEVLPHDPGTPSATCVAGDRAAPPEDCGGLRTADDLAEVLDDPAAFDLDEVNAALQQSYFALIEFGIHPNLVEIVNRLRLTEVGDDLTARSLALGTSRAEPTVDEITAALRPHEWFLHRAADDGIVLTAAGYLKPADVEAVSPLVPTVAGWIGKNNREAHTLPLLDFRESLRQMGLLRKLKGRLLLTKAGKAVQGNPNRLWQHLAVRLRALGESDDRFVKQATLLLLLYAATGAEDDVPLDRVAQALRELGWATSRGPLQGRDLPHLEALDLLRNVSDRPVGLRRRDRISAPAAALARAALTAG